MLTFESIPQGSMRVVKNLNRKKQNSGDRAVFSTKLESCQYGFVGFMIAIGLFMQPLNTAFAGVVTNTAVVVEECGDTGSAIVTFTATDECGNISTSSATFTLEDTTAPTLVSQAVSLTVESDGAGNTEQLANWLSSNGGASGTDVVSSVAWSNNFSSLSSLCGTTGSAAVTFTAYDGCNNSSSTIASFTIQDTTKPTITSPPARHWATNNFVFCGYASGAGELGTATASDVASAVTVTNNAPTVYPVGTTVVIWTATDACGNASTSTQMITIVDQTKPWMGRPADITRVTNAGCTFIPASGGGEEGLEDPIYGDNCTNKADMSIVNDAPAAFPLGRTMITWVTKDAVGNSTRRQQFVEVVDGFGPKLTCPGNITRAANTDDRFVLAEAGGTGTLGNAVAEDDCSSVGSILVSNDAPDSFSIGTTLVTWVATDESGNTTTCTQEVTVVDAGAPELDCPRAMLVEVNDGCDWVGDIGTPPVSDSESDEASIVVTNNAPERFTLGTTVVNFTATDPSGNYSTCMLTVMVTDSSAPTLTVPSSIRADCTSTEGAVVDFELMASDNCGAENITVVAEPPSGSVFPIGTTKVTCTASDPTGNSEVRFFEVVVDCDGLIPPGDCNADGTVDISDAVCYLNVLFVGLGQVFPCADEQANTKLLSWNTDNSIDLSDAIALLNYRFLGGPNHALSLDGGNCVVIPDCPSTCTDDF